MDSPRKCICGNRGVTLIEVVAALLILSFVTGGLGSVFVMVLGQWKETALQIRSQQDGTAIMEEVVRALQAASSIETTETDIIAHYQVSDLNIDSISTFRRSGGTLEKNGRQFFPLPGIEINTQEEVKVKTFDLAVPLRPDSLYRLRLVLSVQYKEKAEDLEMATGFYARNNPVFEETAAAEDN